MVKKQTIGWWRNTYADKVDIAPRGEEDRHIADPGCECCPRLSRDTDGRLMIIHNSFDGREGFEPYEAELPAHYKGRRAA